jgi:Glu-tRNA(Gln) amidotransferase subunit E-like FAD-binding protein
MRREFFDNNYSLILLSLALETCQQIDTSSKIFVMIWLTIDAEESLKNKRQYRLHPE